MRKKFSIFKANFPQIENMITSGYSYLDIVEKLKEDAKLELSVNTLNSYIYRCRKEKSTGSNLDQNLNNQVNNCDLRENVNKVVGSDNKPQNPLNESEEVPHKGQKFKSRKDGDSFIQSLLDKH